MDIATWHILGIAGGLLLMIALLRLAWRGRRVGENACCAKCDYLLVGLPESSDRCPECGTPISLTSGLNVRAGGSHKRCTGWVMVCLVLLIAGVWWEQRQVRGWLTRPVERKPTWLLFQEAKSTKWVWVPRALDELIARDRKGHIPSNRYPELVDVVLTDMQAPKFQPRRRRLGDEGNYDWVVTGRADGKVSDAQWKRFFDDHPPTFKMRPVVSSIEPFSFDNSGGLQWGCTRSATYLVRAARVDGQPVAVTQVDGEDTIDLGKQLPNLPAGKHEITLTVVAQLYYPKFNDVDQWTGTVTLPFEYRTDGETSLERLVTADEVTKLAGAIKPALAMKQTTLTIGFSYPSDLPLCHEMYFRIDGKLERILLLQGGNISGIGTIRHNLLPADAKKVDIVLKPNATTAARSPYLTKLVDREIELKDVSIQQATQ